MQSYWKEKKSINHHLKQFANKYLTENFHRAIFYGMLGSCIAVAVMNYKLSTI